MEHKQLPMLIIPLFVTVPVIGLILVSNATNEVAGLNQVCIFCDELHSLNHGSPKNKHKL